MSATAMNILRLCHNCGRHKVYPNSIFKHPHHSQLISQQIKSSCPRAQVSTCSLLTSSKTKSVVPHSQNYVEVFQKRGYMLGVGQGGQKSVSKAVSDAEKIVGYPTSFLSLRCLLSDELSNIALHMRKLVGTKHPLLKTARGMVFDGNHNLQMRGLMVMLISKAAGPNPQAVFSEQDMVSGVYPSQRSLAEITEVIYTASLIHKGVVNLDDLLPEDGPLNDMEFGNKMAVLSGDYLLASACTGLAKLENPAVVEEVASSIGDMMTAEFTNFASANLRHNTPVHIDLSDWFRQTYLSFGSLLAKSCQAAMMLAGHSKQFESMAFAFGENATYAQQLCREILPFVQSDQLSNLTFTSAPILVYEDQASEEDFEHLKNLWEGGPSNHKKVVAQVKRSGTLDQCKELCAEYRDKAITSLDCFAESEAKSALVNMVTAVSSVR